MPACVVHGLNVLTQYPLAAGGINLVGRATALGHTVLEFASAYAADVGWWRPVGEEAAHRLRITLLYIDVATRAGQAAAVSWAARTVMRHATVKYAVARMHGTVNAEDPGGGWRHSKPLDLSGVLAEGYSVQLLATRRLLTFGVLPLTHKHGMGSYTASDSHIDLDPAPYVVYGVEYIDLVSLTHKHGMASPSHILTSLTLCVCFFLNGANIRLELCPWAQHLDVLNP